MNDKLKQTGKTKGPAMNKRHKNQIILTGLLVTLLIVFEFITRGKLFRASNLTSISQSMIYIILGGYGMMFVFGSGMIDLSIGANILLSAAIGGFVGKEISGAAGLAAFTVVSVLCAIILGQAAVQSALKLKIPAWIAGLGSGLILEALLNIWNKEMGLPNIASDKVLTFFGKAPGMYILVGAAIISAFIIYNKTSIGINLQAVGGNAMVSSNMGIHVRKTIIISTLIGGAFIGLAALFNMSNTGFVNPQLNLGSMSTIFRILAVVMLADSMITVFTQPVAIIYSSALIAIALNIFVLITGKTGTELNFFLGLLVVLAGVISRIGHKGVVK
jgi:ribose transport system permease protein